MLKRSRESNSPEEQEHQEHQEQQSPIGNQLVKKAKRDNSELKFREFQERFFLFFIIAFFKTNR
jgi:hypothetical protein